MFGVVTRVQESHDDAHTNQQVCVLSMHEDHILHAVNLGPCTKFVISMQLSVSMQATSHITKYLRFKIEFRYYIQAMWGEGK